MKLGINPERSACAIELRRLMKKGYGVIGSYGRNADYLYLKRKTDRCAMPFCLGDPTFNRTMRQAEAI